MSNETTGKCNVIDNFLFLLGTTLAKSFSSTYFDVYLFDWRRLL